MKSELSLTSPTCGEREGTSPTCGESEACLSTEIKSEDLEEKEQMTEEGEQHCLSKLETSKNIACSKKMP